MSYRISKFSFRALLAGLAIATVSMSGCSMCCGPYDQDYPVFGGQFQRADPAYGRVGSIFSDPYVALGESSDSNLKPHGADDREKRDRGLLIDPNNGPIQDDEILPNPNALPRPDNSQTSVENWRDRQYRDADAWR